MKNATKIVSAFPVNLKVKVELDISKSFIKDYLNKRETLRTAKREFDGGSNSIKNQFDLNVARAIATKFRIDFNVDGNQKDLKTEIRKVWNTLKEKNISTFVLRFRGQKEVVVRVKDYTDFNESKAKTFLTQKQIESCVFKSAYIEVV